LDKEIPIKNMMKIMNVHEYIRVPLIPKKEKENILKKIVWLKKKYKKQRTDVLSQYVRMETSFRELDLDNLELEAKQKFQKNVEEI